MSRLKYNPKHNVKVNNEYDYKKDLNWRDDGNGSPDGQGIEDPSINDFIKGYNINPYEFKQWASKNKKMTKKAWTEVDVIEFTPEYLADKILKLWNTADGLLQNLYEQFTLRYSNNLKKSIADELQKKGYTVYPLLIDDKPIYAKHKKIFKNVVASRKIKNIIAYSKFVLSGSEAVQEFTNEVEEIEKINDTPINKKDASALIEYYKQIYPQDYAIKLVNVMIDKPEKAEGQFGLYKDFNVSDESLQAMENYMSGNADPAYVNNGGIDGYDFVSDSRGLDGTAPGNYEIRSNKKKD